MWPEFLPDSEDFLFQSTSVARGFEQSEIYLATLRDGRAVDPVLLMENATAARYTPAGGGRLLFVRNDNLYTQALNRTARKLEGEPERLNFLAVSRDGSRFYIPQARGAARV